MARERSFSRSQKGDYETIEAFEAWLEGQSELTAQRKGSKDLAKPGE
jgi:hypothetical protein